MDWDVLASKDSPVKRQTLGFVSLEVKFWCLRTNEVCPIFLPKSQRKWVCFCSTGSASQLQLFRLLNHGPWQIKSIQKYPRSIQQLLSVLSLGLATIWILEFLKNIFAARHLQGQWLVVWGTRFALKNFFLEDGESSLDPNFVKEIQSTSGLSVEIQCNRVTNTRGLDTDRTHLARSLSFQWAWCCNERLCGPGTSPRSKSFVGNSQPACQVGVIFYVFINIRMCMYT